MAKENQKAGIDKLKQVVEETDPKKREKEYNQYVKEVTPTANVWLNMVKAFLVGGIICTIGQGLLAWFGSMGMSKEEAGFYEIVCLILLSVILTGLGWYGTIAKFGGAGAVVPITGFANSVSSPAIEYQKEGQVFGIGCKIFTIAGPVILYGVFASWLLGLGYWAGKCFGFW